MPLLLSGVLGAVLMQLGACLLLHEEDPKPTPLPNSQNDIFMHYMPRYDLVVCGCGKCGTSSMYEYVYAQTFGHNWTYKWEPYVQDVTSSRWENHWEHVTSRAKQEEIMKSAYSFALIRDPKERLISAWKSKVSCPAPLNSPNDFNVDGDGKDYVQNLRSLQGLPRNDSITCMSLDAFTETLLTIHQHGKMRQLDRHFLPQNYGCFDRFGPSSWTKLTTIEEPWSLAPLAQHIGTEGAVAPHDHASPEDHKIEVSKRAAEILDIVTKQEYDAVGKYLPRESWVFSGVWAMRTKHNFSFHS